MLKNLAFDVYLKILKESCFKFLSFYYYLYIYIKTGVINKRELLLRDKRLLREKREVRREEKEEGDCFCFVN